MKLSVVIVGTGAQDCAESLRHALGDIDLEIIVVPAAAGTSICSLRMEGIARAKGERIAILGSAYRVTPGWFAGVQRAKEFDVTGGCIGPSPDLNYLGWCVYLTEYAHVAPPIKPGAVSDGKQIPGGNAVYDRSALKAIDRSGCTTELELHRRLQTAGASFGLQNEMDVLYAAKSTLGAYVRERFDFSRAIATERGSTWRVALAPGLPFLILLRTATAVFRKRRYRLRWLACAPLIFLLGLAQVCGELTAKSSSGRRTGPCGRSGEEF